MDKKKKRNLGYRPSFPCGSLERCGYRAEHRRKWRFKGQMITFWSFGFKLLGVTEQPCWEVVYRTEAAERNLRC